MLIATDNQVFTLGNGTPTQCLAMDGIRLRPLERSLNLWAATARLASAVEC